MTTNHIFSLEADHALELFGCIRASGLKLKQVPADWDDQKRSLMDGVGYFKRVDHNKLDHLQVDLHFYRDVAISVVSNKETTEQVYFYYLDLLDYDKQNGNLGDSRGFLVKGKFTENRMAELVHHLIERSFYTDYSGLQGREWYPNAKRCLG